MNQRVVECKTGEHEMSDDMGVGGSTSIDSGSSDGGPGDVSTSNPIFDLAAVARKVYFENKLESSRSASVPILQKSV